MKLIKKSGEIEKFQIEKISNSIHAANDELFQPISDSALKHIVRDVNGIIEHMDVIESRQVRTIIVGLLYQSGFHELLKHYIDHR